ncbi:MAG: hypothetical protein EOM18_09335 [Clostridia bacterium]|nr:hypothetical protein [Clostridia bacterium]
MKSKMLRRLVVAVATMSFVLVSATSAFAAGSPNSEEVKYETAAGTLEAAQEEVTVKVNGSDVEAKVEVSNPTANTKAPTVAEVKTELEKIGATYTEDTTVILSEVSLVDANGNVISGKLDTPIKLQFNVKGAAVGSKVVVMNYRDGQWVAVPATVVSDGVIEATFDHLSPVAFIIEASTPATPATPAPTTPPTSSSSTSTSSTGSTSPKTGE